MLQTLFLLLSYYIYVLPIVGERDFGYKNMSFRKSIIMTPARTKTFYFLKKLSRATIFSVAQS